MTVEPLEGMDALFVTMDSPNAPLHMGIVLELEAKKKSSRDPIERFGEIKKTIDQRLGGLAILRRRVVRVPFDFGPPVYVDDPDFDLDAHVVRRALPAPGTARELEATVASIMAQPLDPDRPLWQISVIEGLENGHTALVAKIHHALADGVSGVAVFAQLFDLQAKASPAPRGGVFSDPPPIPNPIEMLARSSSEFLRRPGAVLEVMGSSLTRLADRVDGILGETSLSEPSLLAAPSTSLSGTLSYGRTFARLCLSLPRVKEVAKDHHATVTDFALAITGGAVRRLLEERGEIIEKELIAVLPVNIRPPGTEKELGNKISVNFSGLASDIDDPNERLRALGQRSREQKASGLTDADLLADLAYAAGPAMSSFATKVINAFELFDLLPNVANVVVSSVPGPPIPLWCSGERIVRASPIGPLMFNQGLNVTLLSYCDVLEFGILGCAKRAPDIERLRELFEDEARELLGDQAIMKQASTA